MCFSSGLAAVQKAMLWFVVLGWQMLQALSGSIHDFVYCKQTHSYVLGFACDVCDVPRHGHPQATIVCVFLVLGLIVEFFSV